MAFGGLKQGWNELRGKQTYYPNQAKFDYTRPDQERELGMGARAGQDEYLNWLRAGMEGKGPSVAEKQMAAGRDEAIKAAASQAAGARGGQVGLANRSAGMNQANTVTASNRDAAMLRASEQMGYGQQFGAGLQAQRAQDILSRGQSIDEQRAQLDAIAAKQRLYGDLSKGEAERKQGMLGGVLGAISDERAKMDIMPLTPGAPQIRTAGGMQPRELTPSFAEQLASARPGAVEAMDAAKEAQDAAEKAEEERIRARAMGGMGAESSTSSGEAAGAGLGGLIKKAAPLIGGLISDRDAKVVAYEQGLKDAAEATGTRDAESPGLQRSGFRGIERGVRRSSGDAAFKGLSPEERLSILRSTKGIPDLAQGSHQRGEAQRDIALRARERRKALDDYMRDARALDAASRAPAVGDQTTLGPDAGTPGRLASVPDMATTARGLGEGAQRGMIPDPRAARRRRDVDEFLSDMRSKQIYSDIRTKTYSDERTKEFPELAGRTGSGDVFAGGRGRMPDIMDLDAEDSRRDLAPIRPVVARYKPEFAEMQGDDGGLHAQTIAQDHLKSPMYAGTVQKDPETGMLALDRDRLLKANTAELGGLDKRIRELEAMERSKLKELRGVGGRRR